MHTIKMLFGDWRRKSLRNFAKHTCKQVNFLYEVSTEFNGINK